MKRPHPYPCLVRDSLRSEVESKPLEGIPAYQSPIEQSVRCLCGLRYVVFLGGAPFPFETRAIEAARDRAKEFNALFVDASATPFMNCECGQALDFVGEDSLTVQ